MKHAKINTWNLLQPSPHMSTITALRTTHGASCRWAGARPLSPIWQQVAESQLVSCVAAHATWRGRFFKRPAEERPPVLRGVGPAAVPRVRIHQNDVSGGKLEPRRPAPLRNNRLSGRQPVPTRKAGRGLTLTLTLTQPTVPETCPWSPNNSTHLHASPCCLASPPSRTVHTRIHD